MMSAIVLPSESLPPASSLEHLKTLSVFDRTGAAIAFPTLITTDSLEKIVVVFIRHFYCGSCQDFVRALTTAPSLTPSALSSRNAKLIIIGCGDSSLISEYASQLSAPWEFFSDPSGAIYDTLGMHKSLASGKKPDYIKTGILSAVWSGIVSGLKSGPTKGGNITRNGGEFLWVGQKLEWCHRMQNTRDHLEVSQIVKLLED
ncbi:hypothetical protein K440DRAFT_653015 [Wilcoxina mikolae CBS 423.85]|nr:hypothetical protein K440DRAFT_653015 [Wilcoxina mikolae CBS 423.85]